MPEKLRWGSCLLAAEVRLRQLEEVRSLPPFALPLLLTLSGLAKETKLLAVIWRSMRKSLLLVLAQFAAPNHTGISEGHVTAGAHRKATCTFSLGNLKDQSLENEWPAFSCALLHFFSCCRSVVVMPFFFVMLMTSLPQIYATVTRSSLKSMAAQSDLQHNHPVPIFFSTTCPNGFEDGNYLFRSYSKQSWSFCGVSGAGYHELSFQISDCECHAEIDREVCADDITSSMTPSIPLHLSGLHCSADDYSISSTDTCLLITLSDQYGDGWTSGNGFSENAWFGYYFSSFNGDSSAITYHSLNCSCPRMIGCLGPSSFAFAAEDQTIDLAIYSNEGSPVAFSWEIMYLVQVIQNGRLLDSHHGGSRTHMQFSYSHSSGTLSLSSKTDGAPGNGDAVDISKCQEQPVEGLVSDLSLEGWSIVDINSNKQETIVARNPSCVHPHFRTSLLHLDPLQSKLFVQENEDSPCTPQPPDSLIVPSPSRHLAGELGEVGNVTTLAGGAGSFGSTNGVGTIARFYNPFGVSISPDGVYALVADQTNHLIRQIIISTAYVTTLAGVAGSSGATNGVGTIAKFDKPLGVSISPDGLMHWLLILINT
jgi:hypothetical protein